MQSVAPDGTVQIKLTYGAITSTQSLIAASGQRTDLDAALPHGSGASQDYLQILKGQTLIMTMAPDGRVLDIRGLSELVKRIFAALPSKTVADRQAADGFRKGFTLVFNEKSLKQMMGQATTGQYPRTALAIGDSWTQQVAYNPGFSFAIQTRNTLVARAGGIATINQTGTLRMGSAGDGSKNGALITGPVSTKLNLSGTLKGSSRVDEGSGLARYARLTMRIGGRIQVRMNGKLKPGEPREISFPLYLLSTTIVTTQPIAAPATSPTPTP